jgi:hypothetical protein
MSENANQTCVRLEVSSRTLLVVDYFFVSLSLPISLNEGLTWVSYEIKDPHPKFLIEIISFYN